MRILILILCLVALAGCEQRTVDASVLQERRGLAYVPNETEPYTGNVTEYYPSGQLDTEISYVDGKQNGLNRAWYDNGQLKAEFTAIDGKQSGLARGWYENGQLKGEATVINGKQNGLARTWYENGQLEGETNYIDGEIVPKP